MQSLILVGLLVIVLLMFGLLLHENGKRIEAQSRRRQIASWRAAGVKESHIQEVLRLEEERDGKR